MKRQLFTRAQLELGTEQITAQRQQMQEHKSRSYNSHTELAAFDNFHIQAPAKQNGDMILEN